MKSNTKKAIIKKLLKQAGKDGIQKIVVRAIIKRDNKFLLLERASTEFLGGLLVLPGGSVNADEDLLHAIAREVREETDLVVTEFISYAGSFDCISSSGKKTRQFIFFVETESGDIKIDKSEHSNYFLLNPLDEEFSKLNVSGETKKILEKIWNNPGVVN